MPDPQQPFRNRRRFFNHHINRGVKLRLVLDDMAFALAASLIAIGILYVLSNKEIGDTMYSAHISIKQTRELLNSGVKVAGVVTFISVLVFGYWSMIDAHRIAGPMHRLHRLLNEVAAGDLRHEIKFRKKDEFQEIAAAADSVVDVFAAKITAMTQICTQIQQEASSPGWAPGTIKPLVDKLQQELAYFTVPEVGAAPQVDNRPVGDTESTAPGKEKT